MLLLNWDGLVLPYLSESSFFNVFIDTFPQIGTPS
jgi:hypothetical protein